MDKKELQVKSKERVKDFGEVFTNPREVKAMLDLVKDESYRIDSRFLEPACGNGNFLIEILARKLQTVNEVAKSKEEWKLLTLVALGSIYAIDIQADNVEEARERLLNHIKEVYEERFNEAYSSNYLSALNEVLVKNIIHGDGLTGLQHGVEADKEILFSEWHFDDWLETGEVVRKDFSMNEMIAHNQRIEENKKVMSGGLFGMIVQEEKEEVLEPIYVETYHNYKLINKQTNFIDVIEYLNRKISNLGSNVTSFFENNSEKINSFVNFIGRVDFDKIERYGLAIERVKSDSYVQESPLSDVEISFFNEHGHEDVNGNFFIIRLKNGHETKIKKLDKSITGRYMGPKEKSFKTVPIVVFFMQVGIETEGFKEIPVSTFFDLFNLFI